MVLASYVFDGSIRAGCLPLPGAVFLLLEGDRSEQLFKGPLAPEVDVQYEDDEVGQFLQIVGVVGQFIGLFNEMR